MVSLFVVIVIFKFIQKLRFPSSTEIDSWLHPIALEMQEASFSNVFKEKVFLNQYLLWISEERNAKQRSSQFIDLREENINPQTFLRVLRMQKWYHGK